MKHNKRYIDVFVEDTSFTEYFFPDCKFIVTPSSTTNNKKNMVYIFTSLYIYAPLDGNYKLLFIAGSGSREYYPSKMLQDRLPTLILSLHFRIYA